MATITADLVKQLREKTGAGMMDCKKALNETDGDMEKAVVFLREKGLASAQKKSSRIAAEGAVGSYIHMGGKIGVLVEVNCETDFVAKNEGFQTFVKNIAMHIAAANPIYVSRDEVPAATIAQEQEIAKAQAINEGRPERAFDKIIEGRVRKYYEDNCLLDQAYVKSPDLTIEKYLKETIATIGEKIDIRRFTRFQMGEGLEKKQENFAEEIAKQISNS
jgi:elongation factor Ts